MRLLLDTHVFLWIFSDKTKLSPRATDAFLDPENEVFFSVASYWEICIKTSVGKLDLGPNWPQRFDREMRINVIG